MVSSIPNRTKVFISYSHKDAKSLEGLIPHLKSIEKDKLIYTWTDARIRPGDKWQDEIKLAIASTKVAILLISKEFLNSQFIVDNELPALLNAAEAEEVRILPVLVSHCILPESLSQLQMINSPSKPTSGMSKSEREKFWVKVVKATIEAMTLPQHIHKTSSSTEESDPPKFSFSANATPLKTKEQLLKEALTYIKEKNWIKALAAYDQVILSDPYDAIAHYKKGDMLTNLKRYEEALFVYKQVAQIDPFNTKVYNKIGDTYKNLGNTLKNLKYFEEALAAYKQYFQTETEPDYDEDPSLYFNYMENQAKIYINMGDILFDLKRHEEALAAYDAAIEIDPDSIYLYERASMLYVMKRFEEALVAYNEAINSGFLPAYEEKADLLYEMERYEEALVAYDQSIHVYGDPVTIYRKKGKILYQLERYEEVLTTYDNAIAFCKQENEEAYERDYVPTRRTDHNNHIEDLVTLYNNRGDLLKLLGKMDEAQQSYTQMRYFTAKMGYWIYKDSTNWVAKVHCGDSNGPINKSCRWDGAENGKPAPDTWEYVEKLPTNLVVVKGRKIQPIPCYSEKCMNDTMHRS